MLSGSRAIVHATVFAADPGAHDLHVGEDGGFRRVVAAIVPGGRGRPEGRDRTLIKTLQSYNGAIIMPAHDPADY